MSQYQVIYLFGKVVEEGAFVSYYAIWYQLKRSCDAKAITIKSDNLFTSARFAKNSKTVCTY